MIIGIIYWVRGVPVPPLFWTEGYRTPTFQDEKVKNLQSSAVSRGDLRRLNYKKPFSAGLRPGLRWESSRRSFRPRVGRGGNTLRISSNLRFRLYNDALADLESDEGYPVTSSPFFSSLVSGPKGASFFF